MLLSLFVVVLLLLLKRAMSMEIYRNVLSKKSIFASKNS